MDYPPFIRTEEDQKIWDDDREALRKDAWFRQVQAQHELEILLPPEMRVERTDQDPIHWTLYKTVGEVEEILVINPSIYNLLADWQSHKIS